MGDVINQDTIWKFVGSVSGIAGLVCFPHGSPYRMSLGKLGYGGHLVYLFFCSFMWGLMMWDKRIQVPEKFKGVVGAILFVVICSISMVYDNYVPGKSDAYTITSYGSFALMSVSISKKLELGFETGFSAFFLQLFAAQLFKINWFLLPIALVFCFLVIILRHYSDSREITYLTELEHFRKVLRSVVEEFDLTVGGTRFDVQKQLYYRNSQYKKLIDKSTMWKFVGAVSAINGLVCFPQGSLYFMLFEELSYGSLLVYLLVCLFWWSLTVTPLPEIFREKLGMILMLLWIMTMMNYYYDEPRKSDAYSVTSCGSFALMFLSLPRGIVFLFERAAFYVLLITFAIELGRIKWFPLPIAAVFRTLLFALPVFIEIHIIRYFPKMSSLLERILSSTTNNQENNQEESSQAMDRSPGNGQVPEGISILLDSGNQQHRAAEVRSFVFASSRRYIDQILYDFFSVNCVFVAGILRPRSSFIRAPQVERGIQNISQNGGNTPADLTFLSMSHPTYQ